MSAKDPANCMKQSTIVPEVIAVDIQCKRNLIDLVLRVMIMVFIDY